MRTTLVINDELVAQAKTLAAERRCTLSAVVEDALRRAMNPPVPRESAAPFRMPVFGGTQTDIAPHLSPADMASLVAEEDLKPYGKK